MGKALRGRGRGRDRAVEATATIAPAVVNGRRLTPTQREQLAEAEGLAGGTWRERQQAVAIVRAVEAELAAARLGVVVERGIEDTLERARRRGEAFEIETVAVGEWRRNAMGGMARRDGQPILDVQQVRRASRVDGLASLFKAGSITEEEKAVGEAYRAIYERARPPMSVSAYGSTQAGFRDVGHMLVSVAEAGSALAEVSAVARAIGDVRTVLVLEAVAGCGQTVRSLGAGGDLNAANLKRLKGGLAVAKRVIESLNAAAKSKALASKEH